MVLTVNYFLTLLFVSYTAAVTNAPNARIVGGTDTTISSVPYLVNLRKNGNFVCGGSLVSTRHVVTAAHCIHRTSAASLTVYGGATSLTEGGVKRSVQKVYTPKAYRANTLNMDVAVLKLNSAMSGTNIETIELCTSSGWKVGELVQVSGWGLTAEKNTNFPNNVRTVKVPLIAKSTCQQRYKGEAVVTKSMFCASVACQKDSCSGDSGGPAVYKGQLCGIVSWGIGCARRSYPGVYTNVKIVKSFIEKAIKQ